MSQALAAQHAPAGRVIEELPGGASTRRFFRGQSEQGTWVAMYIPAPSQEIAKARQVAGSASFVEVRNLLAQRGVRVPRILFDAPDVSVLFVEDLGHDTLAQFIKRHPEATEELYRTAVQDLARAQEALSTLPAESCVVGRAFDEELLHWEVDHYRKWALAARGLELNESEARVFDTAAHYLAESIAALPRGFVHRDYQSRNLMVRNDAGDLSLTWIDFQDAMLGPRAYDLVALLTDSYQNFSRSFIDARLAEYCRARGNETKKATLLLEFDLICVQRKLKDAGRFVFIDRVNGNPSFLDFVEPTTLRAIEALSRLRSHPPLAELEKLLLELQSRLNSRR